jgi:hypothetical protein
MPLPRARARFVAGWCLAGESPAADEHVVRPTAKHHTGGVLPKDQPWWIKLVGIAAAVILGIVAIPILVLALPFLAVGAWLDRRKRRRLQREFHNLWGAHGKRLLLVYSNSPNWQAYVEERWLPHLDSMAVVLNWSERRTWPERHPLEADIFRTWGGNQAFNPLAIIIPADGQVRVIRFWQAFRDYKHGKDHTLRAAEAELETALGISLRVNSPGHG